VRFALAVVLTLAWAFPAYAAEPRPFVQGSWQELRRAHDGRPTIVHFWGLTCTPCLVELPEWGRFERSEPKADIVMVAADPVAIDPGDLGAALAKAGFAKIESWRFADPFTERLEYEIDPAWQGELPFTVMLTADGTATTVLGTVDFAALRTWADGKAPAASGPPSR
jgi:thiol-disulfide isomerase/thioredoxin